MRGFSPRFVCLSISVTDSHQRSDFCECFPTAYLQKRYRSGVQNFSDVPGKPTGVFASDPCRPSGDSPWDIVEHCPIAACVTLTHHHESSEHNVKTRLPKVRKVA